MKLRVSFKKLELYMLKCFIFHNIENHAVFSADQQVKRVEISEFLEDETF